MTQEEYEQASPEERAAEFERCKDEAYFYNTYWKKEGMPEYSKEDFDRLKELAMLQRKRYINPYEWTKRVHPLLPDFLKFS